MREKRLKKGIVLLLTLCIMVSTLVHNSVTVQSAVETKTMEVVFDESMYRDRSQTVDIPGLFEISGITVDNGSVTHSVYEDSVTISVTEGVYSDIRPFRMEVTTEVKSQVNIFSPTFSYSDEDGFSGKLKKDGSPIIGTDKDGYTIYIQKYEGTVENEKCKFYKYKVTLSYTENKSPEVRVDVPKAGCNTNNQLSIAGSVKDENVGDMVNVYYSLDGYDEKTSGISLTNTGFVADGNEQAFVCNVDIRTILNEGSHNLFIWAVDRKGTRSAPVTTPFIVDFTPPDSPNITQEPENDTPTNKDVQITITFPGDAENKKYKEGPDGEWKDYTGPVSISVNEAVYSVCTDKAGNESPISVITVSNIDKDAPDAPEFIKKPEGFTNQSVSVAVYYSQDAFIKEIRINEGDWKTVSQTANEQELVFDDNGVIEARSTDEAGNISVVSSVYVDNIDKISPPVPDIAVSAVETVSSPVTVTIKPGEDNKSGIKITEYCLKGATVSDWKNYDAPFTVTNVGDTEIWARSVDNAGNVSDISKKTVKIKQGGGGPVIIPPGGNTNPVISPVPSSTQPTPTPTVVVTQPTSKAPAAGPADLAVFISSGKTTYGENETISFTINYRNKSNSVASSVVIKADIPQYTTVVENGGGTVKGSQIEWNLGDLAAGASGELKFKLKVGLLDKAEVNVENKAVISSTTPLIKTEDDESFFRLMLYSNRYDNKNHQSYIVGYIDNTFRPENSITRAEVAAMLVRVLNLGEGSPDKIEYKDFNKNHWAYSYIYSATKYGLFEGYAGGTFKPDSFITRAELSTALARYLKLKNIEPDRIHFSDISNHWARNYIEEIYRFKLIEGYLDGRFMPDSQIKRCETVTIINRMLYRGPLKGADAPFTDVKKDHWAYGHIVESCLDHYYTRNADGSETRVNKEN